MEPVPAHVDAVLRLEVLPRLNQLSRELRHPLEMTVALVKDGMVVGTAPMLSAAVRGGPPQTGGLRLTFKQVFNPDSRLFQAHAQFAPDERTPAFSGFEIEGHVTSTDDAVTTRVGAWIVLR
jgi:hypothetical protein